MKPGWAAWIIGFSIILSLLAAGILHLSGSKPRDEPIRLNPLPTSRSLVVQVGGAVVQPGVYQLAAGSRVQDAVLAAGGLVNQAAPLQDGQLVWVPYIKTAPAAAPTPGADQIPAGPQRAPSVTPGFPINMNTATLKSWLPCLVSETCAPRASWITAARMELSNRSKISRKLTASVRAFSRRSRS